MEDLSIFIKNTYVLLSFIHESYQRFIKIIFNESEFLPLSALLKVSSIYFLAKKQG